MGERGQAGSGRLGALFLPSPRHMSVPVPQVRSLRQTRFFQPVPVLSFSSAHDIAVAVFSPPPRQQRSSRFVNAACLSSPFLSPLRTTVRGPPAAERQRTRQNRGYHCCRAVSPPNLSPTTTSRPPVPARGNSSARQAVRACARTSDARANPARATARDGGTSNATHHHGDICSV